MKFKLPFLAVVALGTIYASAVCSPLHATVMYSYTGKLFDYTTDMSGVPGSYNTNEKVSGWFTVSGSGFQNNLSFQNINSVITHYSFFDGREYITDASPNQTSNISVETDALGNIDYWNLYLFTQSTPVAAAGTTSHTIASDGLVTQGSPTFDSASIKVDTAASNLGGYIENVDTAQTPLYSRGTWTSSTLDTVPLPPTATLFISGLGFIGMLSWRKRKKTLAIAAA